MDFITVCLTTRRAPKTPQRRHYKPFSFNGLRKSPHSIPRIFMGLRNSGGGRGILSLSAQVSSRLGGAFFPCALAVRADCAALRRPRPLSRLRLFQHPREERQDLRLDPLTDLAHMRAFVFLEFVLNPVALERLREVARAREDRRELL